MWACSSKMHKLALIPRVVFAFAGSARIRERRPSGRWKVICVAPTSAIPDSTEESASSPAQTSMNSRPWSWPGPTTRT